MPRSAFILLLLLPSLAAASAPDVFGLGSEEPALGGASSARVHDFSACYYNPAGLTRLGGTEASFGVLGFGARLRAGDVVSGIEDPVGVVVGAAAPVPFGSFLRQRLYVAIALYLAPAGIVRVIAHSPETPFFPYYNNRTQRLVVLPSLAVRIGWGLSAGVALNYLAGLNGQVAGTEGSTRAVEARVDEAIFATVRVNAGLLWRSPADRFALALVYRQAFSVPFTTITINRVAGQPINLNVDAEGLYTPHELTLGGALRPRPWLELSADLTVAFWSAWRGPYVTVSSELPIVGTLASPPPKLAYDDTISVRVGGEASRALTANLDGRLRAGYGFESSPIPDQPGVTNLLDGNKHLLSLGGGLAWASGASPRRIRLRVDAHGQLQILQARTLVKQIAAPGTHPDPATALRDELPDDPKRPETLGAQISNPGYPRLESGGFAWAASLTLTVER